MVYFCYHSIWGNNTLIFSFFFIQGLIVSSFFFTWVDGDVWSSWLGVLYVVSGTTLFQTMQTTIVGLLSTSMTYAAPPDVRPWVLDEKVVGKAGKVGGGGAKKKIQ